MRSVWRGDRGGSAIEAALLIAAVALVMVPALFLLGRAVEEAFSKPCDDLSDNACASRAEGGGGGGGGGGDGDGGTFGTDVNEESPPDDLDDRVVENLSGEGVESAECNGAVTVSPPTRSTICEVTYADSRPPRMYRVVWTDGSDDVDPTPL